MTCAEGHGSGCAAEIELGSAGVDAFEGLAESCKLLCSKVFKLVELLSEFTFLLGSHIAEICHEFRHCTLLAEIFDAECLHILRSLGFKSLYFSLKLIYLVYHF